MRQRVVVWLSIVISLLFFSLNNIFASSVIEGASTRYRFEPGDIVIYEDNLANCPVGDLLPEWKAARSGYECARFKDRIWIRPLEHGTTLYLPLPQPLPEEFSLEFIVYRFEPGRPFFRFNLHPQKDIIERLAKKDYYAAGDKVLIGGLIRVGEPSLFGAKDRVEGNLEGHYDFSQLIPTDKEHHVAVQVRRRRVRFFVDGKLVGHKPFQAAAPIEVLTFYFARAVSDPIPFVDAPVLVRDIRIAGYSKKEVAPQAERDLIRDLNAVKTPEGLKVTLSEAILFDFGKWSLKPEARDTLEKLARLAKLRGELVRVEGHTDDVGTDQFNLVLSELRAHVVALELARLGVDPKRLRPKGFGEARPVVPNNSDANRARNRRVEVIIVQPENGTG